MSYFLNEDFANGFEKKNNNISRTTSQQITVVVPFYNRSHFFSRLMFHIEAQERRVDKVIIVDNGSRPEEIDAIWSRILQSSCDIVLVSTLKSGNANIARNLGFELADNGYVAFLDSDDWWEPHHIYKSTEALDANSTKRAVYSKAIVHRNGIYVADCADVDRLGSPYRLFFSPQEYIAQTSSYVVRKNRKLEPIWWDESLPRHQDYDYFIKIALGQNGWIYLDAANVHIDWEDGGTKLSHAEYSIPFFEKWESNFPDKEAKYFLYRIILFCLKNNDYKSYTYFKNSYLKRFDKTIDQFLVNRTCMRIRFVVVGILSWLGMKDILKRWISSLSH